jgi:FdhD protein
LETARSQKAWLVWNFLLAQGVKSIMLPSSIPNPVPPLPMSRNIPLVDSNQLTGERAVPEECPAALTFDGSTAAVLMATPADIGDLAIGFGLTEGIIETAADVRELDVITGSHGIEARIWLQREKSSEFNSRQRKMIGPTGCGLCGIESLSEALKPCPRVVRQFSLAPRQIEAAIRDLCEAQPLNRETRATHAAGFFSRDGTLLMAREDVGRHNALDKLIGGLARRNVAAHLGAVVLTSRVSLEMVQKTAAARSPFVIAISAPTALAVRIADECGITLIGVVRGSEFEIFTHPDGVTSNNI